jgi:hypothetical protein
VLVSCEIENKGIQSNGEILTTVIVVRKLTALTNAHRWAHCDNKEDEEGSDATIHVLPLRHTCAPTPHSPLDSAQVKIDFYVERVKKSEKLT